MPDTSLILNADIMLDNVQRKLRELYAEWEGKAIKLGATLADGGRQTTFGGLSAVGPPPTAVLPPRTAGAPMQPVMPTDLQGQMQSRWTMGGSGFGAAAGPVPTATTNTFYGDASRALGAGGYAMAGTQVGSWANWRKGQLPQMPPMPSSGYEQPDLASLDAYAQRRYLTARGQAVSSFRAAEQADLMDATRHGRRDDLPPMPEMGIVHQPRGRGWQYGDANYRGGGRTSQPYRGARNDDDYDFVGEVVGTTALATRPRASFTPGSLQPGFLARFNPTMRGITAVGSLASFGVHEADQFVAANQRQTDINRYSSSLTDQAEAAYSAARGTSGLTRSIGGMFNWLRERTPGYTSKTARKFIDDDTVRDTFDQLQEAQAGDRNAELSRGIIGTRAQIGMIGSSGFGAAALASREQLRLTQQDLRLESIRNGRISNFGAAQAAVDLSNAQLNDIRSLAGQSATVGFASGNIARLAGANDPYAAGLAQIDSAAQQRRFQLARDTRGMDAPTAFTLREAEQSRYAGERAGFIGNYNRQGFGNAAFLGSQVDASILSRQGFGLESSLTSIRGQTAFALNNASGYSAYRNGGSVGSADRANIEAIITSGLNAQAQARVEYQQTMIQGGAQIRANNFAAAFQPLQAQLSGIGGNFLAATAGMNPSSPGYMMAAGIANSQAAAARSGFALQTTQIGIGLSTDRLAQQATLARDYVGAQAISTTGAAINDAVGLFASQRPGLARERLQNGIGDLRTQASEYGLSFRAEQFDAFNMTAFSPRDAQNPQIAFDSFNAQAQKLSDLAATSDSKFIASAADASGASGFAEVAAAVTVIRDILQRIAPEGGDE